MDRTILDLRMDEEALITAIAHHDPQMQRRLHDLGFCEGTFVKKVLTGSHDSLAAYRVRGAVIALRKGDAQYIFIG